MMNPTFVIEQFVCLPDDSMNKDDNSIISIHAYTISLTLQYFDPKDHEFHISYK